jgi:hypothetical protein
LQPSIATDAPVVGVAISAETVVPGSATGASHEIDIAAVVKFSVEVAKEFGRATAGSLPAYDADFPIPENSLTAPFKGSEKPAYTVSVVSTNFPSFV